MAINSCSIGSLLAINGSSCTIGSNSGTRGSNNAFIGAVSGVHADTDSSNVVSIGAGADIGSASANVVAIGNNNVVGATSNSIAIGAGAASYTPGTFIMGSVTNPLIPINYGTPYTSFRTTNVFTGSQNFRDDATQLINGILIFNISASSTVTLSSQVACFAQLHDYVLGSYVWGYICNTNTGSATLTIVKPTQTGTTYYGPTSIPAGQGFRFAVRSNGITIDYIM